MATELLPKLRVRTFKQLVMDGDRVYLKPLNKSWPFITEPFEIIGKVIGAYMEE